MLLPQKQLLAHDGGCLGQEAATSHKENRIAAIHLAPLAPADKQTMDKVENLKIPSWFIRLVTGSITLGAPFAVWLTVTVLTLQFGVDRLADQAEKSEKMDELVIRMSESVNALAKSVDTLHANANQVTINTRKIAVIESTIETIKYRE